MPDLTTMLNCTSCYEFKDWEQKEGETVRCADCGKKHNTDSLHAVYADREYPRDEQGNLMGSTP